MPGVLTEGSHGLQIFECVIPARKDHLRADLNLHCRKDVSDFVYICFFFLSNQNDRVAFHDFCHAINFLFLLKMFKFIINVKEQNRYVNDPKPSDSKQSKYTALRFQKWVLIS